MKAVLVFLLIIALIAVGSYLVMGTLIAVLIAGLASLITISVCTVIGFALNKWLEYKSKKQ